MADVATANPLDQVAQIQIGLEKGPITYIAALAVAAVIGLVILIFRMQVRHTKEQLALAKENHAQQIRVEMVLTGLVKAIEAGRYVIREKPPKARVGQ